MNKGQDNVMCEGVNVKYDIFEQELYSLELGYYISFGILGRDAEGKTVVSCSDISVEKDFAVELCNRCNLLGISPIHLLDVIEDSI